MNWKESFSIELQNILKPDQFILDAPMSEHTTFKIGGKADILIFPSTVEEVANVLKLIYKNQIACTIIGNGSNVLVLDNGIRGAVIKFNGQFAGIKSEDTKIIAAAGAKLKDVSNFAADNGLSGLEFAIGIPGSIGGAVFMNAGAYGGEMKSVVSKVTAVSKTGDIKEFNINELDLGYRHSIFQTNGYAICEIELQLQNGNTDEIKNQMDDFTARRESKQPLDYPSAGSTFKRPEGHFAGTLIDKTGLKGLRVGDAMVSTKHAGFVVNAGHATAADVLSLIDEVKRRVYEAHGVMLSPEVRIIGE
ncbi:MAG: UDP-N-acetylmuramate dehydrogenase [Selenomonadaceae bacterium]|nr:UDP-N-acetylmuramate dehydrogenase [Selenomonadaceae bacterium]MBR1858359.1 UDP-N-acetylmuramate dehydrogenase [Selenomonadaceae bacterium]